MSTQLNPYLMFDGNARQAMEFYAQVLGGDLIINTWAELRGNDGPDADRVGHSVLTSEAGYIIMAGDIPAGAEFQAFAGISINVAGDDADRLHSYWRALTAGGTVSMPLERQVWGDLFGICIDQFGVSWMVNISDPAI